MGFYDWDTLKSEEVTEIYRRKVALGDSISVARVEALEGSVTHPHSHEGEEVVIVLKGAWRFHLPSGEVTVRANQMLSIPPGVMHSSEVVEDISALDICGSTRHDWLSGEDRHLHHDPDDLLWAV